ncbi:MAG: penicillin-binding protein 1A, partial [Firmicutes bacterium]|nr:penicillin-binding protein 1A [Bacillota bacterium]
TVPTKADDTHVLVEIDPTTGLLATPYCPERVVRAVVKLPYTVPSYVEDYGIRMPQEFCTAHREPPPPSGAIPPGPNGHQSRPVQGETPSRKDGADKSEPGKGRDVTRVPPR